MKRMISLFCALGLLFGLCTGCGGKKSDNYRAEIKMFDLVDAATEKNLQKFWADIDKAVDKDEASDHSIDAEDQFIDAVWGAYEKYLETYFSEEGVIGKLNQIEDSDKTDSDALYESALKNGIKLDALFTSTVFLDMRIAAAEGTLLISDGYDKCHDLIEEISQFFYAQDYYTTRLTRK